MLVSNRKLLASVAALSAATVLAACSPTQNGEPNPPPPSDTFKAEYNPSTLRLPWPNDAFFAGSTDGTLNLPAETAQYYVTTMRTELNTLDGWGTSAPMNTLYDAPINGSTLSGATVHVIEMYLQNATKMPATAAPELPAGAVSPISRVLQYGTDFTAEVSPDYDSYGKILRIKPLKPLRASTGPLNIGYYVLLTKGIKDTAGRASTSDDFYQMLKDAPADCSTLAGDATAYALCGWTKAQLSIGQAVGIDPSSVAVSWSFTTESVEDTFSAIAALSTAQAIGVAPTGMNTASPGIGLYGKADIYVGTTQVPYYLTAPTGPADAAAAVLGSYWHGPAGSYVTRFNPMPVATSTQTIPLLVTVPNANAAGGACAKPVAGWPVAIVQHGITGNRTQALAMADSFADACFVVASIDLPLHGLGASNPFYMAGLERTFDVDVTNNATSAPVPDGIVDASGQNFINLSNPLTGRDNLREAEADLITFTKSIANLDIDGGGADIDPSRIHYVGLSLGSIVGAAVAQHSDATTVTLAVPGGVVTQLLLDSQTFGPIIRAGLTAAGLTPGSTLFNNRMRDFQAVVDPGDPINHICACNAQQPLHLIEVTGDTVVPNSATERLITAGNLTKLSTAGAHPVGPTQGVYVKFSQGSHGSLFDPTASLAATVEMQSETVQFAASAVAPGGPFVVITDTSVISP